MDKFLESKLFGWLLLGTLVISLGISGMWRLPFSVEWHLFPTPLFWVEFVGVGAGIGLYVLVILQSIKRAGRHSKTP